MGDDSEGYLEDGIIVKTKGTGYIAPRYRQKYYPSVYSDVVDSKNDRYGESPMQQSTPIRQRRFDHHYHHHYNHKQFEPSVSASAYAPRYYRQSASSLPKKYLKSEIIYGRRGMLCFFLIKKYLLTLFFTLFHQQNGDLNN